MRIRTLVTAAVLVAASFTTAFTAGTIAAAASVSWAAKTCAAEQAYVQHPSSANLDVMMTDSFRAPWKYVGQDAAGLYSDVRGGSVKYVAKDEAYFASDCK